MSVDHEGPEMPATTACRVRARLPGPVFVPGSYRLNVLLGFPHLEHVDEIPDALEFEVMPPVHPWRPFQMLHTRGPVVRQAEWTLDAGQSENLKI